MKKRLIVITLIFVVILTLTLAACVPTTAEEAKSKLEGKGYVIETVSEKELGDMEKHLGVDHLESFFRCYYEEVQVMEIYFFMDASSAKEGKAEISEFYEDQLAAGGFQFAYKGKMIYAGTEKAVADLTA